jgi:15-cis-phytoene synthase
MTDSVSTSSAASIKAGSQSFAAAARIFDPQTRDDATMLYAWCRHCDDVIDGQTLGHGQAPVEPAEQLERLQALEDETNRALETDGSVSESFEALRRVVRRNGIDHREPHDLLRGFAMDVERHTYPTMPALHLYCYHVAGVVGTMMAQVMGVRDPDALDRACDLGIAFQLTNIARDIVEDARAGRCYVPDAVLAQAGIATIDPQDERPRTAILKAALILLDEADRYYRSAYVGLASLPPRSAWAIAAARRIYHAIGTDIRRQGTGAWHSRAGTSKATKIGLMMLALGDVALTRVWRPSRSRAGLFSRRSVQDPAQASPARGMGGCA